MSIVTHAFLSHILILLFNRDLEDTMCVLANLTKGYIKS